MGQSSSKGYYTLRAESDKLDGLDDFAFVLYHKIRCRMDKAGQYTPPQGWQTIIELARLDKKMSDSAKKLKVRGAIDRLERVGLLLKNNNNYHGLSFSRMSNDFYGDTLETHPETHSGTHNNTSKGPDFTGLSRYYDIAGDTSGDTSGDLSETHGGGRGGHLNKLKDNKNTYTNTYSNTNTIACAREKEYAELAKDFEPVLTNVVCKETLIKFMQSKHFVRSQYMTTEAQKMCQLWITAGVTWQSVIDEWEYVDANKGGQQYMTYYEKGVLRRHAAMELAKKNPPELGGSKQAGGGGDTMKRGDYVGYNRAGQRDKQRKKQTYRQRGVD